MALCTAGVCFIALDPNAPKFFGFSEFLAALALMVLAWTIADVRYRFRLQTSPIPLEGVTFLVISMIGVLSLLTDLWRAEGWLVPSGSLITPSQWQALLGGGFLCTFLGWVWLAFVRPARFGVLNSRRYCKQLYRAILKGSPSELPEIADELSRSAKALVAHSWQEHEREQQKISSESRESNVRHFAYEALLLIADRKFCRYVVQDSPITAIALFEECKLQGRYGIPLHSFARNLTAEAVANRDSFAYREVHGYDTGFLGYYKPLTRALYGNYELVKAVDRAFDIDYKETRDWDAQQWEVFCRLLLTTFEAFLNSREKYQHSFVLFRAFHMVKDAAHGLYRVNGKDAAFDSSEEIARLSVFVRFIEDVVEKLDKDKTPIRGKLRRAEDDWQRDIYDLVADVMFGLAFEAAQVRAPQDLCWVVQYNTVWSSFFHRLREEGPGSKIVKFKLRRLIYDEIKELSEFPNFKGAKYLGLVLNMTGIKDKNFAGEKSDSPLHSAVIRWTKRNYAKLVAENPVIAADCLVAGFTYDKTTNRITRTGMPILGRAPTETTLELDAED